MRKIAVGDMSQLFTEINKQYHLHLPVRAGGTTNFAPFNADLEPDFDTLKTANTVKHLFLPQVEDLYSANADGSQIRITPTPTVNRPFVAFGVRACDVAALEVLDNVYLSEPIDRFYEARREMGVIVGLACSNPRGACFCSAFGIDASRPAADVATWMVDGYLYWLPQTVKGEKLTDCLIELLETADDTDIEAHTADIRSRIDALPYSNLQLQANNPDNLLAVFDSPIWDELPMACISCGACTFACPTCQCYDIQDFNTGSSIRKFRCWDSCMYSDFTQMAHGNPRKTRKERFRQRFMHKLIYHPENNNGQYSCVGCGRCINKCPTGISIVKISKEMGVSADVQS